MSDNLLSPIDPAAYAALEEVADGDVEFMVQLLGQYLQDAAVLADALSPALETGDAESLEKLAHTLRSSSANVGGMVLSNLCGELQRIGRSGDVGEATEIVPRALSEFGRLKEELENRLGKLSGQA